MLKLNQKIDNRIAFAVIAAAVCVAVAFPALAGTIYSWRTLDGSQAFTDDPKRIPARYRDASARQTLGRLEGYSRYTPSQVATKDPYEERLSRRLEHLRDAHRLRGGGLPEAEAAAPEHLRLGVDVSEGDRGRADHISMPLSDGDQEPIVIESVRIKSPGQITTRTATVIRQGDRVIAVRKNEPNDAPPFEADPVP